MKRRTPIHYAVVAVAIALIAGACTMFDEEGDAEISGIVHKGPVAGANVIVYDLAADAARLGSVADASTNADGRFDLSFEGIGPVEIAAAGGTYRDEATGAEVALEGLELAAFVADARDGGVAPVTVLTTIAAARAAAEADQGLEAAIEGANRETADLFGLHGLDLRSQAPADLSVPGSPRGDAAAYAAVVGGLSQLVADRGHDPEALLDLVAAMADDFASGEIDGRDAAGEALQTASAITPEEAMEGLETAIENYLDGPENETDYSYDDYRADACERAPRRPGCPAEGELSGVVFKGPVAGAELHIYDLAGDGARLGGIAEATTAADGRFDVSFEAIGPAEIAATGGTYRDEATGAEIALEGLELWAFVKDARDGGSAAVTALTTVAAARAAAEADEGIEIAIEEATRQTAELVGLDGIDLVSEAPVDLSVPGEASGDAAAYAAVLGGLSQVVADHGEAPDALLALIAALAEDFASGEIDGKNAAGEALETATAITPEEALEGLETAIETYLNGPQNESDFDYDDYRADACERAPHRPDCP